MIHRLCVDIEFSVIQIIGMDNFQVNNFRVRKGDPVPALEVSTSLYEERGQGHPSLPENWLSVHSALNLLLTMLTNGTLYLVSHWYSGSPL